MSNQITCPSCNAGLRLPEKRPQSKVKCPYCHSKFLLSRHSTAASVAASPTTLQREFRVVAPTASTLGPPRENKAPRIAVLAVVAVIVGVAGYWFGVGTKEPTRQDSDTVATVDKANAFLGAQTEKPQAVKDASPVKPEAVAPPILRADQIFANFSPSVVKIVCKNEDGRTICTGSGFVINDEGYGAIRGYSNGNSAYIVSNHHVIEPAVDIEIQFDDGSVSSATKVVNEEVEADLALLAIDAKASGTRRRLSFASVEPAIGSTVFAIGSPKGLANTLSDGMLSGKREIIPGQTWLQTTAPISQGSSGCPLFANDGSVIGVAVATRQDGQNLNFIIPSSTVTRFLSKAIRDRPVWFGRSIKREADDPAIELRQHVSSGKAVHLEKDVFLACSSAWTAIGDLNSTQLKPEAALPHLEMLRSYENDLPPRLKYWYWFVVGGIHSRAAFPLKSESAEQAKERIASHQALAARSFQQAITEREDFAPSYVGLFYSLDGEATKNWVAGQAFEAVSDEKLTKMEAASSLASKLRAKTREIAATLVKMRPGCSEAYQLAGHAAASLPDPDETACMDYYEKAVELNPCNPHNCSALGSAYIRLERYGDAATALEAGLANAAPEKFTKATMLFDLGKAYVGQRRFKNAVSAFQEAKALGHFLPSDCDDQIQRCIREINRP